MITRTQIHETLGPIVEAAGPGFFTDTCTYYTEEGQPGCIVGQLLPSLGVDADVVERRALNYEVSAIDLIQSGLFAERSIRLAPAAAVELQVLQEIQDRQHPWETALAYVEDLSDAELLARAEVTEDDFYPRLEVAKNISMFESWLHERKADEAANSR